MRHNGMRHNGMRQSGMRQNTIPPNIVMLNAVMLIVNMLSVTAPFGYDITIIFLHCINYTWGLYYKTFFTITYGLL
jgi:hypothetical protein